MYRPFKHSPLVVTCNLTHRAQAHVSNQSLLSQQSMGCEEPEQKDLSSMRSSFVDSFFREWQGLIFASQNSTLRLRLVTAPSCRVIAFPSCILVRPYKEVSSDGR